MYGTYLIDSNILIGFLNGDKKIADWILARKKEEKTLYISFINSIEVLSLENLKDSDIEKLEKFLSSFYELPLSQEVVKLSAAIRRKGLLKLGDAIVAATAISRKCILVTNDKSFAKKVSNFIEVISIS